MKQSDVERNARGVKRYGACVASDDEARGLGGRAGPQAPAFLLLAALISGYPGDEPPRIAVSAAGRYAPCEQRRRHNTRCFAIMRAL